MSRIISLEESSGNDGGVEAGSFTHWTATAGGASVISTESRQGSNSIQFDVAAVANNYAQQNMSDSAKVYVRAYFNLKDFAQIEGGVCTLLTISFNLNGLVQAHLRTNSGAMEIRMNTINDGYKGSWTAVASTTEWFAIELFHHHDTPTEEWCGMWMDGVELVAPTTANDANANANRCYVSANGVEGSDTGYVYCDALEADNADYIGLLPPVATSIQDGIFMGSNM